VGGAFGPPDGVTQRESRPTSNECERTAKPRSGGGQSPDSLLRCSALRYGRRVLRVRLGASLVCNIPCEVSLKRLVEGNFRTGQKNARKWPEKRRWNAQFRRWKTRCFEITARQDHRSLTRGRRPPGRAGVPPQTIIDRDQQSTATAERARPGLSGGSGGCLRTPRAGVPGAASPRLPFPMLRSPLRPAELRLLPEASLVCNMPVVGHVMECWSAGVLGG
jgi:hypothetical protein